MLALLLALFFSNAGAACTFNAVVLYSSSDVTWLKAALLEADLPAAALTSGNLCSSFFLRFGFVCTLEDVVS